MTLIIAANFVNRRGRFVNSTDSKQPPPAGKMSPEACILHNYRPAARQVSGATVTKPTTAGSDVPALTDAKFALRSPNVLPVRVEGHGNIMCIPDTPFGIDQPFSR